MFSSSPLDKSCINSDSCSPGRNNAPNRFSVGIPPLPDENQQIRIQLAVHKYNGVATSAFNNRCPFMSPVRHSFLKNSLKVRNYEGDTEGTSKTDRRNGNQYEGVGAFPTVHLKKSAVRYRPIKRFHDVKIPYPELPVNRFLSHLPEVCPDLKSSTRSVLDVLEDLSGNKIHSKDESGSGKRKPKGLGGDYLLNPNAVYKPLFVQKPKLSTVLTRDSTTQTLSPVSIETPSPQSSSSCIRNGASDPKAELRRKLAKQNNEIFASLSSSISSAFSLKRKIDKVLPGRDDSPLNDGSAQKKTKMSNYDHNENGIVKPVLISNPSSRESLKSNRKSKPTETSSVSPNKDRLTTIFLDTRNTSPKAQMFQSNSTETNSIQKDSHKISNGLSDISGSTEDKIPTTPTNNLATDKSNHESAKNSPNISFSATEKPETGQLEKPTVSFSASKETVSSPKNTVVTSYPLQIAVSTINAPSPSSSKPPAGNGSESTAVPKASGGDSEKKENESKDLGKPFAFGTASDKPNFGAFKFGADGATASQDKPPEPVSAAAPLQFSFGTSSSVTSFQTPAVTFGVTSSQNTHTYPAKPLFTFVQNPPLSDVDSKTSKADGTGEMSKPTTTTATTAQSIQPVTFTFGPKPGVTSAQSSAKQGAATFASPVSSVSTSSAIPSAQSGGLFAFGQSVKIPVTSASPQEPSKVLPFSFGQKPVSEQMKPQVALGQPGANLFSEQKTESTQSSALSSGATSSAQKLQQSATSTTPQVSFSQSSLSQPSNTFGVKFQTNSSTVGLTPVFPSKQHSFGSSVNDFPKTTTATGFTSSTSTATAFAFGASTQSSPTFGPSSTAPSISAFSNAPPVQSAPAFSASASLSPSGFITSPTTHPQQTFGLSSNPQPTSAFGSSSTKAPSFGTTTTTQSVSTFSASSQPAQPFGTSSTTQTTSAFGAPLGFPLSSSQPASVFGAVTSTQSPISFGAPTTQNNTFAPSGFSSVPSTQPNTTFGASAPTSTPAFPASTFDSKPPASLSQTPGIFAQNSGFSSGPTFNSTQSTLFPQKPNAEPSVFGENKIETSGFGSTSQAFGSQNKFSFGMSASSGSSTGFTASPPSTAAPPVFSFGGAPATGNAFAFGSGTSGPGSAQSPFAFKESSNDLFKFGAATTAAATTTTTSGKEGTGFGASNSATFTFGSGQINSNPVPEQKPSFSFGSSQPSTSGGFNFGTTPSPSVFNFGSASSSASSGSGFSFGAPTPGMPFGQTPSPGAPFAVPGTFNIGSGSSQSRPRASSRPRRRP